MSSTVTGSPTPVFTWYKDSEQLNDKSDDGRLTVNSNDVKTELQITNAAISDNGEYKVVASNQVGLSDSVAKLTIKRGLEASKTDRGELFAGVNNARRDTQELIASLMDQRTTVVSGVDEDGTLEHKPSSERESLSSSTSEKKQLVVKLDQVIADEKVDTTIEQDVMKQSERKEKDIPKEKSELQKGEKRLIPDVTAPQVSENIVKVETSSEEEFDEEDMSWEDEREQPVSVDSKVTEEEESDEEEKQSLNEDSEFVESSSEEESSEEDLPIKVEKKQPLSVDAKVDAAHERTSKEDLSIAFGQTLIHQQSASEKVMTLQEATVNEEVVEKLSMNVIEQTDEPTSIPQQVEELNFEKHTDEPLELPVHHQDSSSKHEVDNKKLERSITQKQKQKVKLPQPSLTESVSASNCVTSSGMTEVEECAHEEHEFETIMTRETTEKKKKKKSKKLAASVDETNQDSVDIVSSVDTMNQDSADGHQNQSHHFTVSKKTYAKELITESTAEERFVEYSEEEVRGLLPVFLMKPEPTTVESGSTLRIACKLAENPPAMISWSKNGKKLEKDDERLKFVNDESTGYRCLEIAEASSDDVGEYSITAESEGGIAKYTVSVGVTLTPTIRSDSIVQTKTREEKATNIANVCRSVEPTAAEGELVEPKSSTVTASDNRPHLENTSIDLQESVDSKTQNNDTVVTSGSFGLEKKINNDEEVSECESENEEEEEEESDEEEEAESDEEEEDESDEEVNTSKAVKKPKKKIELPKASVTESNTSTKIHTKTELSVSEECRLQEQRTKSEQETISQVSKEVLVTRTVTESTPVNESDEEDTVPAEKARKTKKRSVNLPPVSVSESSTSSVRKQTEEDITEESLKEELQTSVKESRMERREEKKTKKVERTRHDEASADSVTVSTDSVTSVETAGQNIKNASFEQIEVEYSEEEVHGLLPIFLEKPSPVTVKSGEPLKIECKLAEHPQTIVTWSRNGEKLGIDDERLKVVQDAKRGTNFLEIAECSLQDTGEYTVTAESDGGIAKCSVFVTVADTLPVVSAQMSKSSTEVTTVCEVPVAAETSGEISATKKPKDSDIQLKEKKDKKKKKEKEAKRKEVVGVEEIMHETTQTKSETFVENEAEEERESDEEEYRSNAVKKSKKKIELPKASVTESNTSTKIHTKTELSVSEECLLEEQRTKSVRETISQVSEEVLETRTVTESTPANENDEEDTVPAEKARKTKKLSVNLPPVSVSESSTTSVRRQTKEDITECLKEELQTSIEESTSTPSKTATKVTTACEPSVAAEKSVDGSAAKMSQDSDIQSNEKRDKKDKKKKKEKEDKRKDVVSEAVSAEEIIHETTQSKSESCAETRDVEITRKEQEFINSINEHIVDYSEEEIEGILPVFLMKPEPITVVKGETLRIACKLAENPHVENISWTKNGSKLADCGDRLKIAVDEQTGCNVLEIAEARDEDSGSYSVTVECEGGMAKCTVSATVVDASTYSTLTASKAEEPHKATDKQGDELHQPSIRPLQNQKTSAEEYYQPVQQHIIEETVLRKKKKTPCNETSVQKQTTSEVSSKLESSETIRRDTQQVDDAEKDEQTWEYSEEHWEGPLPVFLIKPEPSSVKEGHQLRLSCRVATQPLAEISWSKNGEKVKPLKDSRICVSYNKDTGDSYMEINDTGLEDAGEYTVRAENEGGIVACTVTVTVLPEPKNATTSTELRARAASKDDTVIDESKASVSSEAEVHVKDDGKTESDQRSSVVETNRSVAVAKQSIESANDDNLRAELVESSRQLETAETNAPSFVSAPVAVSVGEGTSIRLSYEVKGKWSNGSLC